MDPHQPLPGRRARALVLLVVALMSLGLCSLAVGSGPASAAVSPCSLVPESTVGNLFGPTATPKESTLDDSPACEITVGSSLTVTWADTQGGSERFSRLRSSHPTGSIQRVGGYVDDAFFGWGVNGATDFVARRGGEITIVRLIGTDADSNFDAARPKESAPSGDVSGSVAGSNMWALTTKIFATTVGSDAQPSEADLTGLWRTTDITPCSPEGDIPVRVSRFADDGGTLTAKKVAGDSCLDNGATDFSSSNNGGRGDGRAFGDIGAVNAANGAPYRLTVVSATVIRLTGQAGSIRYTHEYQRLSWPELLAGGPVSTLLGIPTPAAALTPKNVALSTVVVVILLLLVVFPTTLFNSTLEANMERYRKGVRDLVAWFRRVFRRRAPETPSAKGLTAWQRPGGVMVYLAVAAVLSSLLQPSWGLNVATLITLVGFGAGTVATSGISIVASRLYLRRRYKETGGHPDLEPSTLGIAALCVAASRLVGFVPGYIYGVVVHWDTPEKDADDPARILLRSSIVSLVLGVGAWLLMAECRSFGGADHGSWRQVPLAVVSGIFVTTVDSVFIGMIPLRLLPGHRLRSYRPWAWGIVWGCGIALFVLVLLQPGLVSGRTSHVYGTLALAAGLGAIAVAFWALQKDKGVTVLPAAGPVPGVVAVVTPWPTSTGEPSTEIHHRTP